MEKPFTNKQYAKSGGNVCPFCRGKNVEAVGAIMPDDRDGATLEVECKDYGRTWKDIYRLAGYECKANGEGTPSRCSHDHPPNRQAVGEQVVATRDAIAAIDAAGQHLLFFIRQAASQTSDGAVRLTVTLLFTYIILLLSCLADVSEGAMDDWIQYLTDLIGERVKVSPDAQAAERLPVFMGSAYAVLHGRVLDQSVRFLVPKRPARTSLPDVIRDHGAAAKNMDGEVVLVLPEAPAYVMKRLMRERIPFIIPGRQAYLPRHVVALRTPPPESEPHGDVDDLLSPRAQALLLYHIEKRSLSGQSQVEVSRLLGWTPMTVSRCVRELHRKGLCRALTGGRSNIVSLDAGRDIWERTSPRLSSPIMVRRFAVVPAHGAKGGLCEAGVTALSRYTMIGEDPVPSFAVHHRLVRDMVRRKALQVLPYRDEGCVTLELWRYDPVPLSKDGIVDRLSLYLSLRGNPDERIEGSLRELLEGVKW